MAVLGRLTLFYKQTTTYISFWLVNNICWQKNLSPGRYRICMNRIRQKWHSYNPHNCEWLSKQTICIFCSFFIFYLVVKWFTAWHYWLSNVLKGKLLWKNENMIWLCVYKPQHAKHVCSLEGMTLQFQVCFKYRGKFTTCWN